MMAVTRALAISNSQKFHFFFVNSTPQEEKESDSCMYGRIGREVLPNWADASPRTEKQLSCGDGGVQGSCVLWGHMAAGNHM